MNKNYLFPTKSDKTKLKRLGISLAKLNSNLTDAEWSVFELDLILSGGNGLNLQWQTREDPNIYVGPSMICSTCNLS